MAQGGDQEGAGSAILIMDSSGSMNADVGNGQPKIAVAKRAIEKLADAIPPKAPTGLEIYGARYPNTDKRHGCRDIQVVLPVARHTPAEIKAKVRAYKAKGFTPIGRALETAARALPPGGERTIVLVSDGIDSCAPPDPCAVARRLAARGLKLKIEAVGFQVDASARKQLRCIARVTGGVYRDATADTLGNELAATFTRALRLYHVVGAPIHGGPTYAQATRVAPGQYVDMITQGQERWYEVPVAVGQAVLAAATIVPRGPLPKGLFNGYMSAALLDAPDSQVDSGLEQLSDLNNRMPVSVGVAAKPTGRPGQRVYRVKVSMGEGSGGELAGRTYPLELFFDTPGKPNVAPKPAGASAPAGGNHGDSGSGGTSPLIAVLVGVVLAALGFGLASLGFSRRGREAPA